MVAPAVAARIAGQNMSGLSLISPNTAGSEPSGTSVEATRAMKKTVLRPTSGSASTRIIQSSMASIVPIIDRPG